MVSFLLQFECVDSFAGRRYLHISPSRSICSVHPTWLPKALGQSISSRFVRESSGAVSTGKLRQDMFLLHTQRAGEHIVTVSVPATVHSQWSVRFGDALGILGYPADI
jgi:hypothetical protein